MNDFVFGEQTEPASERRLLVIWPLRPVNLIEGELSGEMIEHVQLEQHRAPIIYIEDDTFNAEDYSDYGPLTVHEALAMQRIVYGDIAERYRRQRIIARELGEHATMELYLVACEAEGIDPILKGPNR